MIPSGRDSPGRSIRAETYELPRRATRPPEEPREGELERDGELALGEEPAPLEPREKLGAERVEGGLEMPGLLDGELHRGAEKIDLGVEDDELLRRGADDSRRGDWGGVNVHGLS